MDSRSSNLEALVDSLTPSEQRYFRLFSGRYGKTAERDYLRLFDSIRKAGTRGKGQIRSGVSPSERNYLTRMILQSLRVYHEDATPALELRNLLANVIILQKKRLITACFSELRKAKDQAMMHEQYAVLIDLFTIEQSLIIERNQKNVLAELDDIHRQMLAIEEMFTIQQRLLRLSDRIFLHSRLLYQVREEDRQSTVTNLMEEVKAIEVPAGSLRLQHLRLKALAAGAICLGDFHQAFDFYSQLQEIWVNYPDRIKSEKGTFLKVLSNFLVVCHALGDFSTMRLLLDEVNNIHPDNFEDEAEQFQNACYLELLYLMNTDGYEDLDQLVARISKGLARYAAKINKAREFAFYYNVGLAYFLSGNFKDALQWIKRIIDHPVTENRKDIQIAARLIRLIIFYEMNENDTLEYELVNLTRYLKQRKAWFAYESAVVRFFDKLIPAPPSQKNELFAKFSSRLEEATEGKTSASLPGSSEIRYWIKSKLTGKSMRELLREEHKQ